MQSSASLTKLAGQIRAQGTMHFVFWPIVADPLHERQSPQVVESNATEPRQEGILGHIMDQIHAAGGQLAAAIGRERAGELEQE